jgi:hypothetical protein
VDEILKTYRKLSMLMVAWTVLVFAVGAIMGDLYGSHHPASNIVSDNQ